MVERARNARPGPGRRGSSTPDLRVLAGLPRAEWEEDAGRAGPGAALGVEPASSGGGPGPGRRGRGSARRIQRRGARAGGVRGIRREWGPHRKWGSLSPSRPAGPRLPCRWGSRLSLRSASVVFLPVKLAPRLPTGLPSGGSPSGLLPAVASAREVPGQAHNCGELACGEAGRQPAARTVSSFLPKFRALVPGASQGREPERPPQPARRWRWVGSGQVCRRAVRGAPPPAERGRRPFARGSGARPRSSPCPARYAPSSRRRREARGTSASASAARSGGRRWSPAFRGMRTGIGGGGGLGLAEVLPRRWFGLVWF